jgi:hypothetical protein
LPFRAFLQYNVSIGYYREAICECNYDIASEDWFNYIEDKYNKTLTDYEHKMLNDKFTEERNRYPKRIER